MRGASVPNRIPAIAPVEPLIGVRSSATVHPIQCDDRDGLFDARTAAAACSSAGMIGHHGMRASNITLHLFRDPRKGWQNGFESGQAKESLEPGVHVAECRLASLVANRSRQSSTRPPARRFRRRASPLAARLRRRQHVAGARPHHLERGGSGAMSPPTAPM